MACVKLFAKVLKANHMASKVPNNLNTVAMPNDFDTVAKSPGYSAGIKLGYCS